MRGRRGVRRLAVVFVVLGCLMPTGARGQTSGFLTTTSTTTFGDPVQASDIARAIAGLEREPTTTTTTTAGERAQAAGVGPVAAAMQGGTTTTTLSPAAISNETNPAALVPPDPAPNERTPPRLDQGSSASRMAFAGAGAGPPASSSLESPLDGTTTPAVASPPSLLIPDLDQVALAEEPGGAVRLPVVGLETHVLARWMLLIALLFLVAPSVVQALRGERR